jgi:hypothetical protein
MGRITQKMTYTDGYYFCNVCDEPHECEELAEECYDKHGILDQLAVSGEA